MSFIDDGNDCPTCQLPYNYAEANAGCGHRKSHAAHLAFRQGRDAYGVPASNGDPVPDACDANPYEQGTDERCWWFRGYAYEAMSLALALEGCR